MTYDSFVDRDMYMRYRGGGVGHVVPVDVPNPEPEADEVDVALENDPADSMEVDVTVTDIVGQESNPTELSTETEEAIESDEEGVDDEDENEDDVGEGEDAEGEDRDDEDEDEDLLYGSGDLEEEDPDVETIVDLMNDTLGYGTL